MFKYRGKFQRKKPIQSKLSLHGDKRVVVVVVVVPLLSLGQVIIIHTCIHASQSIAPPLPGMLVHLFFSNIKMEHQVEQFLALKVNSNGDGYGGFRGAIIMAACVLY